MGISPDISSFLRPTIKSLTGVSYNKSPDLLGKKVPAEEILKLNGNENPYGCSPRVNRMLAEYQKFHIYPDFTQQEMRKMLAEYVGANPENIVATAGGDQLLDVIIRLFVDAGDEVITCVPTYDVYRFNSQIMGARIVEVPRDKDYNVDIDAVLKAITDKTKMVFLCNPNNPTGNTIPEEGIIRVMNTGVPTVVDEAYFEFSKLTMLPWLKKYPNLMLIRTFSKWAALAGFRLGYGIMNADLVTYLYTIKPPFAVGGPALVAFRASMEDKEYLLSIVKKIVDERERVYRELSMMKYIKPYPSKGNFIFLAVLKGEASRINQEMEDRGILIRHYNTPYLKNGLRITIGKPEQNDRVLFTLKALISN